MTGRAAKTVSDESQTLDVDDLAHKDDDQDRDDASAKDERCDAHSVISVLEPASEESQIPHQSANPEIQPEIKKVHEASDVIRSVSQYALSSGLLQTSGAYVPGPSILFSENMFSSHSDVSLASDITVCNVREGISSAKSDSNIYGGSKASFGSLIAVHDQTTSTSEASFTSGQDVKKFFPVGKTGSEASSVVTVEGIAALIHDASAESISPAAVCDTSDPTLLVKKKTDNHSPEAQEAIAVGSAEAVAVEIVPGSRGLKGKGAKRVKSSKKQLTSQEEVMTSGEAPIPSQEVAIPPEQSDKVECVDTFELVREQIPEDSETITRTFAQLVLSPGLFPISESSLEEAVAGPSNLSDMNVHDVKEEMSSATSETSFISCLDQSEFCMISNTRYEASSVVPVEAIASKICDRSAEYASSAAVCDTTETLLKKKPDDYSLLVRKKKPDESEEVKDSVAVGSTEADTGKNLSASRMLKGKGAKYLKSSKKHMPSQEDSHQTEKEETSISSQEVAKQPKKTD